MLSPEQLLERLGRRLDLLRGGRDADARQQTLRATIEWSYELLEPAEQQLFARLAVFAGGCTLEAAEAICDAELDTLQSLVDKSLVRVRDGGRFWMLETIREYALEQLEQSGEAGALRRRHLDFFLDLAEAAGLTAERVTEERFDLVLPDQDNARAALDWALAADPVAGLRLVVALEQFWVSYGPREGVERTRAFLERVQTPELRARGLRAVGSSANQANEPELAERCYEESLSIYRELGDDWGIAHLLMRLTHSAHERGDRGAAETLADESLEVARRNGFVTEEVQALTIKGTLVCEAGDYGSGIALLEEGARRAGEIGFSWWQIVALQRLTRQLFACGRSFEAESRSLEALKLADRIGDRMRRVYSLALLARAAAERRDEERAGRIWGALEAEVARHPLPWELGELIPAERVFPLDSLEFTRARVRRLAADARRGGRLCTRDRRLTAMAPPRDLREWIARARARGRARSRRRRGRPRPRGHRDRRPHRQVRWACAPVREPEGRAASAADQPVRHGAAHVPRLRRRAPRRHRRAARGRARDAAAAGADGQGARPQETEVDRRLAPEDGLPRRLPGDRADRRRHRSRPAPDPALLARRSRAVHHAPRGDHEGSEERRPQRGHVPDAEDRRPLDLHALAAAQGRARRLPRDRRAHPGRGRARARPDHRLLGERAAAEAHRRADARGLPQGRARRARPGEDRRPRGAGERRDRPRGDDREGRGRPRGAVRRPHRLLHRPRAVPDLPAERDHDAPRRDLPLDRRRQAAAGGRLARQGDRAHLPAGRAADGAGDRRLRPPGRGRVPQLRHRLDPQGVPRATRTR